MTTRLDCKRLDELARGIAGRFSNHVDAIDKYHGRKIRGAGQEGRPHGFQDEYPRQLLFEVIDVKGRISFNGSIEDRDAWMESLCKRERWLNKTQRARVILWARWILQHEYRLIAENGEVL